MEEIIDHSKSKKYKFYMRLQHPLLAKQRHFINTTNNRYENICVGVDYNNFFGSYFKAEGVPLLAIFNPQKKLTKHF